MTRVFVICSIMALILLSACTVVLTPHALVIDTGYTPATWRPVEVTPTPETLPSEMPTPRPTTMLQNSTANRYHIRQCHAPDCTHLGWIEPGAWIEADLFTVVDGWVQVFRDDIEVGWVSSAAFGEQLNG